MTLSLLDLPGPECLSRLDSHLSGSSFVNGPGTCGPTQDDVAVFVRLGNIGSSSEPELPNLQRWARHMRSYSAEERSKFPKANNDDANFKIVLPEVRIWQIRLKLCLVSLPIFVPFLILDRRYNSCTFTPQ